MVESVKVQAERMVSVTLSQAVRLDEAADVVTHCHRLRK